MRVGQVVSEAALGLRRNLVMTVAAIVTVAVSLAFAGAALLVRDTTAAIREDFYTEIDISVFLTDTITDAQRTDVEAQISTLPLVDDIIYEDKDEAYRRFTKQFADNPDLTANVEPDALPESFRVSLTDPEQYDVVASALQGQPGVQQVQDYRDLIEPYFRLLDGLQKGSIYLAVVQLIASTLLIGNTVRVAAFNRRRETGVMRLVGATRLYISLPFLLEGVFAGVVGALLAGGLMAAAKALVLDRQLFSLFEGTIDPPTYGAIAGTLPPLVLIAVLVSGVASVVALRRFVRV